MNNFYLIIIKFQNGYRTGHERKYEKKYGSANAIPKIADHSTETNSISYADISWPIKI